MIQKALAMAETKNHHTPTIRAHGLEIFASRFKIVGLWCLVRAGWGERGGTPPEEMREGHAETHGSAVAEIQDQG